MSDLGYLLALNSVPGLGPVRIKLLLEYFGDPEKAWEASEGSLKEIKVGEKLIQSILQAQKTLSPEQLIKDLEIRGIKAISIYDPNYPKLLLQIHDPPVIIYYRGDPSFFNSNCIAVVGTRKITSYGKLVTEKFTSALSGANLTIVSGLARGVDSCAHQTAINTGGKTIAVLGSGLNNIYPTENLRLAQNIWESNGLVISEFLPDEESFPGNFPARNRIISGLSKAVLVTEAALDSGSLITAKDAIDQGRDVYAVPGQITSDQSQGTLSLIKEGARLVTDPQEILDEMGLNGVRSSDLKDKVELKLSDSEKKILESLVLENKHIDEIIRETKLPASAVTAALVKMEILGAVKNMGGGVYLKV